MIQTLRYYGKIPSGNHRLGYNGKTKRHYRTKEYVDFLNSVHWEILKRKLINMGKGQIRIRRLSFYHHNKFDIDNLMKSCFDALKNILFADDKQLQINGLVEHSKSKEELKGFYIELESL